MFLDGVGTRDFLLLVPLAVGLVVSLVCIALSFGEQHGIAVERFRLVFPHFSVGSSCLWHFVAYNDCGSEKITRSSSMVSLSLSSLLVLCSHTLLHLDFRLSASKTSLSHAKRGETQRDKC